MTTIVAYTYEADIHCVNCPQQRFGDDVHDDVNTPVDREGNPVHPVFITDEITINHCNACSDELIALSDEPS